MRKVLYITNIVVPYRVSFFNHLAKGVDLTVLYERRSSANRDSKWATSNGLSDAIHVAFLDGKNIRDENSFSFRIISWIRRDWDDIIIGCVNSKVQMLAMLYMRAFGIPFYANLDGESFIDNSTKGHIKKFFLRGAKGYFTAGDAAASNLKKALGDVNTIPYYFSSLSEKEIERNGNVSVKREPFVLVVGQYYDYKGMDVALSVAKDMPNVRFKFVGMGKRTQLFINDSKPMSSNIEVIPFLQKNQLEEEYRKCQVLLLPSRQECWGLVVNEAASFGTPIVSTWGSGAAVEFLSKQYSQYLALPGDAKSLEEKLKVCLSANQDEYSQYLLTISKQYTIERSVESHLKELLGQDAYMKCSSTRKIIVEIRT